MKKFILAVFGFFIACSSTTIVGCGDTFITNNNTATVAVAHLEKGYMYFATQNTNYNEGAAFWMDNAGNLQTDWGSGQYILSYINDEDNPEVVIFTVLLPWYENDTLRFIARKSPFKYDQIPAPGNSTYPFRGVGIVNLMNFVFVYDQENSIMHFFNAFNGDTWSKSAVYNRDSNRVDIEGGQELLPNSVSPNPLGTNVHEWHDPAYHGFNIQVTAYRLFWGGGSLKNPGHVIKSKSH